MFNLITISETLNGISVKSPYNKQFVEEARRVGAKWNYDEKTWTFPSEAESYVNNLLVTIYGESPLQENECVTIDITLDYYSQQKNSFSVEGVELAWRHSRDSKVITVAGTEIIEGKFSSSAGTRAKPALFDYSDAPVVLRVKDFPAKLVKAIQVPYTLVPHETIG